MGSSQLHNNSLVTQLDSLTGILLSNKEKLLMAKQDARKNTTECTEKIKRAKDEHVKVLMNMMAQLYDQMIANVNDNFEDVSTKVDSKSSEIDSNLFLFSDIKESSKTVTSVKDIVEIMTTVNVVAESITFVEVEKFTNFQYDEYQQSPFDDLQKLTGSLYSKDARIDVEPLQKFLKTPPLKTIQNASELKFQG